LILWKDERIRGNGDIEKSYYTWWIYSFGKEAKTALDTTSKFMKLSQEEIYNC